MKQNAATDADLVVRSLAGDREAFAQLYDRYARSVRAVALGVSGDWSAVEDLVQETFLRAYRNLGTLRDPQRFDGWIAGVARQVGRERRRTLRRDRHEFREPLESEVAATNDPSVDADARDQVDLVIRTIALLPEQERLAIHLFFLNEQNASQAAELLEMSRSGFYALLQRALTSLAAAMQTKRT